MSHGPPTFHAHPLNPPAKQHAPIALGAAGARVIVAQSYARIFFRNCIATGECYPYECPDIRLCDEVQTGHEVRACVEECVCVCV